MAAPQTSKPRQSVLCVGQWACAHARLQKCADQQRVHDLSGTSVAQQRSQYMYSPCRRLEQTPRPAASSKRSKSALVVVMLELRNQGRSGSTARGRIQSRARIISPVDQECYASLIE